MRFQKLMGQDIQKLQKSKVLIIGIGALGSVVADILGRIGCSLTLIDRDVVEESNLERQMFSKEDVGMPKALQLSSNLQQFTQAKGMCKELNPVLLQTLDLPDIILDGTDNLATRFLLNDYAKKHNIPFIYASAIKHEGYVGRVCVRCFLQPASLPTCEEVGVNPVITHTIASLQAEICMQTLLGRPTPFLYVDVQNFTFKELKVKQNCPACKGVYEYLEGNEFSLPQLCGGKTFAFTTDKNYEDLKHLPGRDYGYAYKTEEMLIFPDGRILVHANSEEEARQILANKVGL